MPLAPAIHAALFFGLTFIAAALGGAIWPLPMIGVFVLYGAIVALTPLRASIGWLRPGKLGLREAGLVFAAIVLSTAGLALWYRLAHPDVSDVVARLPDIPAAGLVALGLGLAVVNAAGEEIAYRGVLTAALENAWGPGIHVLLAQAVLFGAAHYAHGFPRGVAGFVLTGIYGLMMGWLRERCDGLLAPFLAHVGADMAIFLIVAFVAR
jgi:membrane protease YdiL (CAAX protease family)